MAKKPREGQPWEPAPYEDADVGSMKALYAGTADAGQQKRALDWIMFAACGLRDLPWRPGGPDGARASDFAAGKQFVGKQIAKLIEMRLPSRGAPGHGPAPKD